MKTHIVFPLIALFLLSSCASQGTKESFTPKLTLIHTTDRFLEFEPCGCSFRPLGGLEREWNYTSSLKKDGRTLLYLVSGKTFFTEGSQFSKSQLANYKAKVPYLMEAFEKLGVSVVAPSLSDLNLGEDFLRSEAKKHGVKLLATNLKNKKGKPVWDLAYEFTQGDTNILVLSVLTEMPLKLNKKYEMVEASEAIEQVLKEKTKTKNYFVVLLTDGEEEFRSQISVKNPKINMVLGSQGDSTPYHAYQLQKSTAQASVRGHGKSLVAIDLAVLAPVTALYSSEMSAQMSRNEKAWQTRLAEKDEPEKMQRYLAQVAEVPRNWEKGFSRYELNWVDLDEKMDNDSGINPMRDLNERMKARVRKINMAGK